MELGGDDADLLLGDGTEEVVPRDVICADAVFDLTFHPTSPFLAMGLVSGAVEVHEYQGNQSKFLSSIPLHTGGITGMEFTENGAFLVTVSSDKCVNVLDCATQKTVIRLESGKGNPHKYGISSVNICSDTLVATGDDDGLITLWDMRERKAVKKYHEHGDYVSQMLFFSEVNQIISSSGDTCLGVYDLRAGKIIDYSVMRNDELNCLAFVPETNHLICGTPSGSLPVWKYGSWSRPFDAFDFHPRECETIVTYNDNIVLTGACDGLVRVLQMHPVKRNLCQLGGNLRRQGITRIRISYDRNVLAVCGQDNVIQFIDISFLSNDAELDKMRSWAEQRHLATLREATAEMDAQALKEQQEEAMADDDSDWTNDDDDDDEDEGADSDDDADDAIPPPEAEQGGDVVEEEDSDDDDSGEEIDPTKPYKSERQRKRERVAAAKWLKEEKKKKVNFTYERRRRRVSGFWGDLVQK